MTYKFIFSFNLGKLVPGVEEICDLINRDMHEFGFSETMHIRSEALEFIAETETDLTVEKKRKFAQIILKILNNSEKFKSWNIRFERIERY